ncbi:DUF551 domain-containing protein [Enterobacter hormaechei]|uniref:DUF551 domain-containing protein n=1 Tax=Enterobacter hormaechei TaxID=158836 RepID=UPI003B88D569
MSTITREFTKEQLQQIIETDHVQCGEASALARIALASLEAEAVCVIDQSNLDYLKSGSDADVWPASRAEMGDVLLYRSATPAPANAEPVAWLWSHRKHPSEVSLVRPEDDERAEGVHWSGWSCQALYAAPPAPISVPDEVCWEDVPEEITEDDMALASAWAHGFNQCRAAMLQGVDRPQNEPQNIPENIPATQFKPVADLYGLTSPTGGETSFTFDAVEARDFIDGGWLCQEYVELERFQEAITNHTEDKLAMVDHSGDSNNMVEPVTTAYKLPDDFDFDRFNDVVWLEAVASNPHMHSLTTSTIAMVALELNRKLADCNSPVIPDGWIPVSERMPGSQEWVIVFAKWDNQQVLCWDDVANRWTDFEDQSYYADMFTHWMPLPAAPQQEA